MNELESPARRKWRELIVRQRAGGLSVAEFCRREGVPASSFFSWKRRLSDDDAVPAFIEARISPARGQAGATGSTNSTQTGSTGSPQTRQIEIRLRGGRRVRVGRGFDRDLLAEVVAVMEGLS